MEVVESLLFSSDFLLRSLLCFDFWEGDSSLVSLFTFYFEITFKKVE